MFAADSGYIPSEYHFAQQRYPSNWSFANNEFLGPSGFQANVKCDSLGVRVAGTEENREARGPQGDVKLTFHGW